MKYLQLLVSLTLCAACSATKTKDDVGFFDAAPEGWRQADEWLFFVAGRDREPLGYLRLYLTRSPLESEDCDVSEWYRADVIENELDYEIDAELAPGYKIIGPWITVDLSATSCNIGYKMVGTATNDGAAGHFNVVHSLGGGNIGEFMAIPADDARGNDDD